MHLLEFIAGESCLGKLIDIGMVTEDTDLHALPNLLDHAVQDDFVRNETACGSGTQVGKPVNRMKNSTDT